MLMRVHCTSPLEDIFTVFYNDPAITCLGIYPSDLKTEVNTNIYTLLFVEPLFIIAKNWKQSRCLMRGMDKQTGKFIQ